MLYLNSSTTLCRARDTIVILLIGCFLLWMVQHSFNGTLGDQQSGHSQPIEFNLKVKRTPVKTSLKVLLPHRTSVYNCQLSPVKLANYSKDYLELRKKFDDAMAKVRKRLGLPYYLIEGHSATVQTQYKYYQHIAQQAWVNTICEIGFNAGHSAFQWLASTQPSTKLYSFDICEHKYTPLMAAYLNDTFPGRFTLTCGDSTHTLPLVTGLDSRCDLVIVDGGHTFDIAMTDLKNFRRMANPENHVLIMDDIPGIAEVKRAWDTAADNGLITEFFVCTASRGRGFALGYYN